MTRDDISRLRQRVQEELRYSKRATDPAAARAHYALACAYRDRIDFAPAGDQRR